MSESAALPNPIRAIRDRTGLDVKTLAQALQVPATQVYRLEEGHLLQVPATFLAAIARYDVDPKQLESDYAAWLQQQSAAAQAQLRESLSQS